MGRTASEVLRINRLWLCLCVATFSACSSSGSDGGSEGGSSEPAMISFAVASGDINGDGLEDLSTSTAILSGGAPPHEGFLSVLLQDAANPGSFARSATLDTDWDPGSIEIADFNGDTVPDLAVQKETLNTNDSDGRFKVFYQDSSAAGVFSDDLEMSLTLISDLESVDVNDDGLADLVTVGLETTVFVNTLGSPGTFTVNQAAPIGGSVVVGGDLNGDGHDDLVIGVGASGVLRILMQKNSQFSLTDEIDVGDQLNPIFLADVNLDGRLDILAGSFPNFGDRTSRVSLVLQASAPTQAGVFLSPVHYQTGSTIRGVAAADVNADALPDIVTAHNFSTVINNNVTLESGVGVLLQKPDGSFESAVTYAADGQASDITLGDFNGDGLIDIGTNTEGAVAFFNDPASPGTFLPPVRIGP